MCSKHYSKNNYSRNKTETADKKYLSMLVYNLSSWYYLIDIKKSQILLDIANCTKKSCCKLESFVGK